MKHRRRYTMRQFASICFHIGGQSFVVLSSHGLETVVSYPDDKAKHRRRFFSHASEEMQRLPKGGASDVLIWEEWLSR